MREATDGGVEVAQTLKFLQEAEAQIAEMERLWLIADESGKLALLAANPFYGELEEYFRCQQSVVQARDSAVINEGQIIIT